MRNKKTRQAQRLDALVEAFKMDSVRYRDVQTPPDTEGKRRLLRSLMNIRMPRGNENAVYACVNAFEAFCPKEIEGQSICVDGDIGDVLVMLQS